MNAVRNQNQPNVVLIGFPVKRTIATVPSKHRGSQIKDYPMLAVTRSKSSQGLSKSRNQKEGVENEFVNKSSNILSSPNHRVKNGFFTTNTATYISKGSSNNSTNFSAKPRASSLPVWPVTDPKIARQISSESSRSLPKPKLSPNLTVYRSKRKTSDGTNMLKSESLQKDRTFRDVEGGYRYLLNSKQPSRCNTPMSEYDPDKLNIKQVVKFLDNHDQDFPRRVQFDSPKVRQRPFTVALSEGNITSTNKYRQTRSRHRSPFAARRFMKSAKSTSSVEHALSVSTLPMADKNQICRKSANNLEQLVDLAARYHSGLKTENIKATINKRNKYNEKPTDSSTDKSEVTSLHHFGRLKYKSATFHTFPTNKIEKEEVANQCNGQEPAVDEDSHQETARKEETGANREFRLSKREVMENANFNATNAIRLPSVFDNMDLESEVGSKVDNSTIPRPVDQVTLSDNSESFKSESSEALPCNFFKHRCTENRHTRNLAIVLSREKSSELPKCVKDMYNKKTIETRKWINFGEGDSGKVVELKLTHGSPSM